MIHIVPRTEAVAAVKRINESKRTALTSFELELEALRSEYPRVSKDALQDGKTYGVISIHLNANSATAYLEVWKYCAKGTYWKDSDALVAEDCWGRISDKRISDGMVLCNL